MQGLGGGFCKAQKWAWRGHGHREEGVETGGGRGDGKGETEIATISIYNEETQNFPAGCNGSVRQKKTREMPDFLSERGRENEITCKTAKKSEIREKIQGENNFPSPEYPQENGGRPGETTEYGGENTRNGEKRRHFSDGKRMETGGIWYRNIQHDTPGSVVMSDAGKGR